jgi:subtilisin family serine protease
LARPEATEANSARDRSALARRTTLRARPGRRGRAPEHRARACSRRLRRRRPGQSRPSERPRVAGIYRSGHVSGVGLRRGLIRGGLAAGVAAVPTRGFFQTNGRGVTIALLDTGVDANHPCVSQGPAGTTSSTPAHDRPLEPRGIDAARAPRHADGRTPRRLRKPAKMSASPPDPVLPIRVAGWRARALGGPATPISYWRASSAPSTRTGTASRRRRRGRLVEMPSRLRPLGQPSARAVAGRSGSTRCWLRGKRARLRLYGASPPGGSRALTVGAADLRDLASVRLCPARWPGTLDRRVPLAGAVAPRSDQTLPLSLPRLGPAELTQGSPPSLDEFFTKDGLSLVAGRAALVPAGNDPGYAAAQAAKAGASSVVLYGDALPGGGIGLDDGVTSVVVSRGGAAPRARRRAHGARVDRQASSEARPGASRPSRPAASRSTGS